MKCLVKGGNLVVVFFSVLLRFTLNTLRQLPEGACDLAESKLNFMKDLGLSRKEFLLL